jgi:hypothetical protein
MDTFESKLCNRCKIAYKDYQSENLQKTNEKKTKTDVKKIKKIAKDLYKDNIIDENLHNSITNVQS